MVEEIVHDRIGAVGRRDEVADHLHHRVGALFLVAVDVGLDEDRDLDPLTPLIEQRLSLCGIGQHDRAELRPALVAELLLVRLEGVHDDAVQIAPAGGLADHLEGHPFGDAGRVGLVEELLERAPDRLVRDQCERLLLLVRDVRAGCRVRTPGLAVGRAEARRDRVTVPRGRQLRAGGRGHGDRRCHRQDRRDPCEGLRALPGCW